MGQNVYPRQVWAASGAGGGTPSSKGSKPTIFYGRVLSSEGHTPMQYIVTIATSEGEKRLKVGLTNYLGIEKGQTYLFTCKPNTGLNDGAYAQWRVTKKPELAVSSGLKPRYSNP